MNEEQPGQFETAPTDRADDVKSRILRRISKEVEASRKAGQTKEFEVATGNVEGGAHPVAYTYYKGGSYVKTDATKK